MKEVCMPAPAIKEKGSALAFGVALGVAAVFGAAFALALGTAGEWRKL